MTTPQETFGLALQTVAGQAFDAAGYTLQDIPMYLTRGLFRYRKILANGTSTYIEFQLLHYQAGPSKFRVNLLRNIGADARAASKYPEKIDTTLGRLLWDVFGVQQLSGPDHWWQFSDTPELGQAIVEAAKLVIAFGMPWLEGELQPGQE